MINSFSESYFRTYQPENGTGNEYHPYKGRGKGSEEEKARKVPVLNQDFQPQKHPVKKDMSHSWELDDWYSILIDDSSTSATRGSTAWYGTRHTAWMASVPLNLANHPTHVCSGSWLHTVNWIKSGNQKVPETCAELWHYARVLPLQ